MFSRSVSLKGNGDKQSSASFNSPNRRRYFGRRDSKDRPHHERILTERLQKVENLRGHCSDISAGINNWYEKLSAFHYATEDLSQCFLSVYRGTKEKMESVVNSYSKEVDNTKNRKLTRLQGQIEKFSKELETYRRKIELNKDTLKTHNKLLSSFKHYTTKCAGLKVKEDKCKDAGKPVSWKQKEKVKRNQEKLGQAKATFFKEHQEVIERLQNRWDSRFSFLDNFVSKVISNELMFFESYTKSLQSTKQILENVVRETQNYPEPSPWHDRSKKKEDFPANVPISDSAQFDTSTSSEATNKNRDSATWSVKDERSINAAVSEGEEFLPVTKSQSPVFALEGTPKKSKRKKTKTPSQKSTPIATPSNPFASTPVNDGQDPFSFTNGEPGHCEVSTEGKRIATTPNLSRNKATPGLGEENWTDQQTSGCNGQNPFEPESTKNVGSPDPFASFFEENK